MDQDSKLSVPKSSNRRLSRESSQVIPKRFSLQISSEDFAALADLQQIADAVSIEKLAESLDNTAIENTTSLDAPKNKSRRSLSEVSCRGQSKYRVSVSSNSNNHSNSLGSRRGSNTSSIICDWNDDTAENHLFDDPFENDIQDLHDIWLLHEHADGASNITRALAYHIYNDQEKFYMIEKECQKYITDTHSSYPSVFFHSDSNVQSLSVYNREQLLPAASNLYEREIIIYNTIPGDWSSEEFIPDKISEVEFGPALILRIGVNKYAALTLKKSSKVQVKAASKAIMDDDENLRNQICEAFLQGATWSNQDFMLHKVQLEGSASIDNIHSLNFSESGSSSSNENSYLHRGAYTESNSTASKGSKVRFQDSVEILDESLLLSKIEGRDRFSPTIPKKYLSPDHSMVDVEADILFELEEAVSIAKSRRRRGTNERPLKPARKDKSSSTEYSRLNSL